MANVNENKFLTSGDPRRMQKAQQSGPSEWEGFSQEVRRTLQGRGFGTAGFSPARRGWVAKEYLMRRIIAQG